MLVSAIRNRNSKSSWHLLWGSVTVTAFNCTATELLAYVTVVVVTSDNKTLSTGAEAPSFSAIHYGKTAVYRLFLTYKMLAKLLAGSYS